MTRITILLVGTADTKSDELGFMRERLHALGAEVRLMDVGVLAAGGLPVDITHDEVAAAAGSSLRAVLDAGDENAAMTIMARGAAAIATQWHADGRIQGLLALGGTMGTDLALDVADEVVPLHDAQGLQAFVEAMRAAVAPGTQLVELDAHINDAAFCTAALQVFDDWVARGLVVPGRA